MKIYKTSKKVFLTLAITTLVIALVLLFFKHKTLGNFMLGLFASTSIIYIQSYINYKIEISKSVIPYLKEAYDSILNISFLQNRSLEDSTFEFNDKVLKIKNNYYMALSKISILSDYDFLNNKDKEYVNEIYNQIVSFGEKVHLIFDYYDECNEVEKRFLFIDLYNVIQDYDFNVIFTDIINLAKSIDIEGFINSPTIDRYNKIFNELKYKSSKSIYMNKIKNKYKVEYSSIKEKFELNKRIENIDKKMK